MLQVPSDLRSAYCNSGQQIQYSKSSFRKPNDKHLTTPLQIDVNLHCVQVPGVRRHVDIREDRSQMGYLGTKQITFGQDLRHNSNQLHNPSTQSSQQTWSLLT